MAGTAALFGARLGGATGVLRALVLGEPANALACCCADRMVPSLYRRREVDKGSAPWLIAIVSELAARAGLSELFATRPFTEERIARLRAMAC